MDSSKDLASPDQRTRYSTWLPRLFRPHLSSHLAEESEPVETQEVQIGTSLRASAFAEGMRQQMFCIVQFRGGRGSTAAQPTNRELAPDHAAGKVPVPWGRKCQWETTRPAPKACSEASCGAVLSWSWPLATAQSCREHSSKCELNGAYSPDAFFRKFGRCIIVLQLGMYRLLQ